MGSSSVVRTDDSPCVLAGWGASVEGRPLRDHHELGVERLSAGPGGPFTWLLELVSEAPRMTPATIRATAAQAHLTRARRVLTQVQRRVPEKPGVPVSLGERRRRALYEAGSSV